MTSYTLDAQPAQQTTHPSIGYPIANSIIYILDGQLIPVPIGVPGDLYIGGDCLARNYHHRSDLTAEKFRPNPFAATPGERLYRTGDLARFLADGRIEFLGRGDHQVKIRGFRIELGEIEATLQQRPAVCEAVVLAREDVQGAKYLVAYIIPNQSPQAMLSNSQSTSDAQLSIPELRGFLKEKLPSYMEPAVFVILGRCR